MASRGVYGSILLSSIAVAAATIAACSDSPDHPPILVIGNDATVDAFVEAGLGLDGGNDVDEAGIYRRDGGGAPCTDAGALPLDAGGSLDGGPLGAPSRIDTNASISALTTADFNGDGRSDVVATTTRLKASLNIDAALLLFIANPDGTLGAPVRYDTGAKPPFQTTQSITVGDLNGDGRTDVAIPTLGGVGVFYQNSGGSLDAMTSMVFPTSNFQFPTRVRAGDMNGDGRTDIVAIEPGGTTAHIGVYLQSSSGVLQSPVRYDVLGQLASGDLELADMDGDGRLDVVILSDGGATVPMFQVVYQRPNGTLGPEVAGYSVLKRSNAVALADLNRDCLTDVLVGPLTASSYSVSAFLQQQGNLAEPAISSSTPYDGVALAIVDLDLDGKKDAVMLESSGEFLMVLPGKGNGTFGLSTTYPLHYMPGTWHQSLAVGDLDGNGKPDLVVGEATNETPGIYVFLHR